MTNYIVTAEESQVKKTEAERLCRVINDRFGYRIADPDYHRGGANRAGYYTGGIKLSERGAKEVAERLAQDAL